MGIISRLFGSWPPAWQAPYKELKAVGDRLVQQLPIPDQYYEVLKPRFEVVLCGRDVNGAIDRYNVDNGTDIDHSDRNHTFIWCSGPAPAQPLVGKYSPLCKYVVFLVGDDQFWDRVGSADELGHLLFGKRSHWLGE